MPSYVSTCLFGAVCLVPGLGCGPGDATGGQVTGTVTADGSPVAGARVSIYEADGGPAPTQYSAVTNDAGEYDLTGGDTANRAVSPGKYKVTVYKLEPITKGAVLPEDMDAEQIEASGMGRNVLPREFASPKSTPLEMTVVDGENPPFEIAVTVAKQ